MNTINRSIFLSGFTALLTSVLLAVSLSACGSAPKECISITGDDLKDSPYISWIGRCEYAAADSCMYTHYAATGYTVSFTGTQLSVEYRASNTSSPENRPYFAVAVDGENIRDGNSFCLTAEKQTVVVAEGLPYGEHTVTVLKRSEPENSLTSVTGFYTDGAFANAPESSGPRFQILGGSGITGHGCLGKSGEPWTTANSSPFESFGYLVAEHYGAQTQFVSASGMGLIWSYRNIAPLTEAYNAAGLVAQYDEKGNLRGIEPTQTGWNHHSWKPDVILVNIGGNDWNSHVNALSGSARQEAEDQFRTEVTVFLNKLLTLYPDAYVVWTTSNPSGGSGKIANQAIQDFPQRRQVLLVELDNAKNGADNHADRFTHQANAERIIEALEQAGFSANGKS